MYQFDFPFNSYQGMSNTNSKQYALLMDWDKKKIPKDKF